MSGTLLVSGSPGEVRVALLADGRVLEVAHRRAGLESVAGSVFLGRVSRLAPGLDAAFVHIGLARAGFLNAADTPAGGPLIGGCVREGEAVLVQATRDPVGEKGARLTMRPRLPGRLLVYAPSHGTTEISRRIADAAERARLEGIIDDLAEEDESFVVRTAAAGAGAEDIAADVAALRDLWRDIGERRAAAAPPACLHDDGDPVLRALRDHGGGLDRVIADTPDTLASTRDCCARVAPGLMERIELWRDGEALFESFGVEEALDEALAPRVDLPSGGALMIEETAALTAIDVDGGGGAGALAVNLDAAAAIAHQLRLRAIGGLVVVDFIHMTRSDQRRRVLAALDEALAGDRAAGTAHGFSRLGLVELTRRRQRPSLADVLCEPGSGRRKTAASVAHDIARALVREARSRPAGRRAGSAAPEVAEALSGLLSRTPHGDTLGCALEVRPEAGRERESYDIVAG